MKTKQLFIGIDVSKGYSDFVVLTSEKQIMEKNFQLDDNLEGHKILKNKLEDFVSKGYSIVCGVENTGGYERNWVSTINSLTKTKQAGRIEIYKLNPKAVKHQIVSLLRRTVDDGVSAEGIAMYMINNYTLFRQNWQHSMDKSSKITEEQLLHKMIMGLNKQLTAKKNQLEKLLYQTFPEILKHTKNSTPNWVYKLLIKYPSSESIKRAKLKGLISIKGISESKANMLKEKANNSVASLSGKISELIVSQHCKDIMMLEQEIENLKKVLIEQYEGNPGLQLLTKISGIADWSAVAFLLELGDVSRFKSRNQIAAFYGVNPSFKQSGDGKYRNRMSKQGSASMRAILFIIAHNLVMHNEYFRSVYAKHKARGKKDGVTKGIMMHKVLRVLWGVLKTKKEFDQKIDMKNQQNNKQEEMVNSISLISRRHQNITMDAPISRTNGKKRKAMLEPQSSNIDERTRSSKHSLMQT